MSKLFVANWKSNKSREEVERWVDDFEELLKTKLQDTQDKIVIAPPYPDLMFVSNRLLNKDLHAYTHLAVQDISPFPAGSYTGAVSGRNLEGFGVGYVIVGHSERRKYFHESHQDVANKVAQALKAGLKPIVCVDQAYIEQQAQVIDPRFLEKCIVAYEPLAAIGTGESADPDQVKTAMAQIKAEFGAVSVLYGGSIEDDNVELYTEITDGFLVGGASLDPDEFAKLIMAIHSS
jgi:triosephosphate isomerase